MIATLPQILHFDGSNRAGCQSIPFHVERLAMQTIPNDVPKVSAYSHQRTFKHDLFHINAAEGAGSPLAAGNQAADHPYQEADHLAWY